MSDLHDALNELANRGAPRGFDDVLAAAASAAREGRAERVDGGAGANDLDVIPLVDVEPIARRSRPARTAIVAAGLAALLFVGVFAVGAVVGSGGSASAEGAVRRLADAIRNGDPLAAADVIAPDEVRSLHGTLDAAERKAQELAIVKTAGAPLAGVDFDVAGLQLSTADLADGYAKVTIDGGTLSASTHKHKFSPIMQKVLRDSHDNSASADLTRLAASNDLPTFVMVVRREGKWYVSAAYTLLEYVREANHLPAADFGSGARDAGKLGGATPDDAVEQSMRALSTLDYATLIDFASPSELPVYDYRAALTELARRDRENRDGGPPHGFTISTMTTSASVDGDTAHVRLNASGTMSSGRWSLDGGCLKETLNDTTYQGSLATNLCALGGALYLWPLPFLYGGLDASSTITVVKDHGRWFVSPVGTVLDVVDDIVSKVDRRAVYLSLGIPYELPADGPLTLGRPVVLTTGTTKGTAILSYDGHRGEQLLGLAAGNGKSPAPDEFPQASVEVLTADGSLVAGGGGILTGHALTLPADGAYKFVIFAEAFRVPNEEVAVTLWDAAHAPADAKIDRGFNEDCVSRGIFGSMCSSSGSTETLVGPTATTACAGSSGGGVSCTSASDVPIQLTPLVEGPCPAGSHAEPFTVEPPVPSGGSTAPLKACVNDRGEFVASDGTVIKSLGQNGGGSYGFSGASSATTAAAAHG